MITSLPESPWHRYHAHPNDDLITMTTASKSENLVQLAESAVRKAEEQARKHFGIRLPDAEIDYSLRGRCAGQARVTRNGKTFLRLNLQLLSENLDDFLQQTIPHEVAHLVVNWQNRKKRQRPRPHGDSWQNVMQECFGLEPVRCHSYKTRPARIVPRNFLYRCNCREHRLTGIMHNRIKQRYNAICKTCRKPLEFVTKEP